MRVDRIVKSSGRVVPTIQEGNVFYVCQFGRTVSGPFNLDDQRFALATGVK